MARLWPIAVGGALLAPLVTWLPMLAALVPALGLPAYPAAQGLDLWQLQVFWLVALGAIAVLVGQRDPVLGSTVAMGAIILCYRGAAMDPTHTAIFAFGALLLVGLRRVPRRQHQRVRVLLVAMAAFQGAYAFIQWRGYDPLWGPWLGGTLAAQPQMLGTLGSVNATAGYLAVVLPLMPVWLAVLIVPLILLSHSMGAIAAMIVGVAMCFRTRLVAWLGAASAILAAFYVLHKATHGARVMIWSFSLEHFPPQAWLTGWGLGGWAQRVPELQQRYAFSPTGEIWTEAHNEPLQWVVETGLVGALFLGCWLWRHRAMFAHPVWGPSVCALAVQCLTWHPFHIVSSALLGLIVIGLASRPYQEDTACAVA